MQRAFTNFIGVDLGGGKGRNTAVARLSWRGERLWVEEALGRVNGQPFYDQALCDYLLGHVGAVCAIDAPLTLPACVRCTRTTCPGAGACADETVAWLRARAPTLGRMPPPRNGKPPATPYTQRAAEIVLHRHYDILPRETLGQGMGPLTARAQYLKRALAAGYRLGENLIEVYPKATIHMLFGQKMARGYKRQTAAARVRLEILEDLAERGRLSFAPPNWREFCDQNDHLFDAVICAYTAFLWAREGWTLPAADRQVFEADGWIWFPPAVGEDG
jgi:predicted nuclease with RNAse H fold